MDDEIKKEFEKVWGEIEKIKENLFQVNSGESPPVPIDVGSYVFGNKTKDHGELLEDLLKSDFCHSSNGLSLEEVLEIFRQNGRPVVKKKISDLLHAWKKRKKIEAIKIKGQKKLRYFWIEDDS